MRKQEEGTNVAADEYWFERLVGSRGLFLTPCSVSKWKSEIQKQSVPSPSGGTGLPSLVVLLLNCTEARAKSSRRTLVLTALHSRGLAPKWPWPKTRNTVPLRKFIIVKRAHTS